MIAMRLLAIFFTFAIFQLSDGTCPQYWTQFRTSCYIVVKDLADWFESKEFCRDFSSYLVQIDSQAEDNFVKGFIHNNSANSNLYWIGGSDLLSEGHWMWADSQTAFTYTNWYPGEPNNSGGKENCMEYFASQAKWNDDICSKRSPFICETEATGPEIVG